jgi:hypothetical protein
MREARVSIIFGRNGTGKSTFLAKILKKIGGRAVVVTYAGMPKIWRPYDIIDPADPAAWDFKKGIKQVCWMQHEDETSDHIFRHFRKGILVFDDCREYIPDRLNSNKPLKRLVSSFRHLELDIFFIVHGPADVPRQVWNYQSACFVGATDMLIDKNNIKIGSAERIYRAQLEVNKQFRQAYAKQNKSHYGIFKLILP